MPARPPALPRTLVPTSTQRLLRPVLPRLSQSTCRGSLAPRPFQRRTLATTTPRRIDILESADEPAAAAKPDAQAAPTEPSPLTPEAFQEHSDLYMELLQDQLEAMQEKQGDVDVEYSAGVLTAITTKGTYVLNKQPPNRQIWISSPVSGPKRYDWVMAVSGMDEKQEAESPGEWVYLRDGSKLSDLLKAEIGVDMVAAFEESA